MRSRGADDGRCRNALVAAAAVACAGLSACHDQVPRYGGPGFTSDPAPPGPMKGTIVATNSGDDTLSVFDPQLQKVRWQFPIGFVPVELEGPHHLVADPTGAFIYVNLSEAVAGSGGGPHGSHGSGTIPGHTLKLSTTDGSLIASTRVDNNPGDILLSPDGSTLFVTHYDLAKWIHASHTGDYRMADSKLVVIDAATMTIRRRVALCPAAHGAHLSADGNTLYASCGPDEIAVVNLQDPTAAAQRVLLPGGAESAGCTQCPYALGVAPDGLVWVSMLGKNMGLTGGGSVRIFDPALAPAPGFDPERGVSLCGRALFPAFVPDAGPPTADGAGGYRAYVPEQGQCGDHIRVFRAGVAGAKPVEEADIVLSRTHCFNAHAILIAPDRSTGYVVCEGDHVGPGSLVTLDLQSHTVTGSVPLGVFPDGLALVP